MLESNKGMNGTVLEEGTLGGNGLFTLVFLLGRRSRRIPAGLGMLPLRGDTAVQALSAR